MATIKVLVDAGKANAGPPIGPALGPLGVNTVDVVKEINKATKDLEGMQVPVKIHINSDKSYSVEVGAPLTSALIKKELNLKKASGVPNTNFVGNLTFDQLIKITKAKYPQLISRNMESGLKEVVGTCRSLGVTIDGLSPEEITKKINNQEYKGKY
ncbi:MAG: 50S ribosomal protein L11 [Candidatus ainarchaeum sp.]|nr:50S ribosomal protein L11 [Candidatus ainarchaeum sp.]